MPSFLLDLRGILIVGVNTVKNKWLLSLVLLAALLLAACGTSERRDESEIFEDGYERGYADGVEYAFEDLPEMTLDDIPERLYEIIYDTGYENAKIDALENDPEYLEAEQAQVKGFSDGYDAGFEDGRAEGYQAGYEAGRKDGYSSGYEDGKHVASLNSSSTSSSSTSSRTTPEEQTVYITRTGSKYHRDGCQYLNQSKIPISLSDAQAQGYTACSKCW